MTQTEPFTGKRIPRPIIARVQPRAKLGVKPAQAKRTLALPKFTASIKFKRLRWRELSWARVVRGGRVSDFGRFSRYAMIVAAGIAFAWGPALAYLKFGKVGYTAHFTLILPGAGSSSSVNLADIGQASSASSSAYSSPSISPTITFKTLIMSANVLKTAGALIHLDTEDWPAPTVKLVDETSFINVEMGGRTPDQARDRANAIQEAFLIELNKLRDDEGRRREASTFATVHLYEQAANEVRQKINDLQVRSGINSVEQYNGMVASAEVLKAKVAEIEATIAKDRDSAASLAANLHLTPALAALTMKLHADPEFAALVDASSKTEALYSEAAKQFGSNHPKVVEARAQFSGVHAQMMARAAKITGLSAEQFVGKIDLSPSGQRPALLAQLINITSEQQGLEGEYKAMKATLDADKQKIARLLDVAAKLDSLNREYKIAEAVFASALARVNSSKSDIFASYPMVQVIEAAAIPEKPSSPNKGVALGAAVGSTFLLLFACLLGWIRRPLIDKLLRKPGTETHVPA